MSAQRGEGRRGDLEGPHGWVDCPGPYGEPQSRSKDSGPFRGNSVMADETLDETARRVASENVGAEDIHWQVEQIGTYSEPSEGADTRVVSVNYVALIPDLVVPSSGLNLESVRWWMTKDLCTQFLPYLAFLTMRGFSTTASKRARASSYSTSFATSLVEELYTLRDLRRIYEAVWGVKLEPGNFRRKVLSIADLVVQTMETRPQGRGHPAESTGVVRLQSAPSDAATQPRSC